MLGVSPDIVRNYVDTGKIRFVFWPVLNHGNGSLYSTISVECVGQQSGDLFWDMHHKLYTDVPALYRADRDYFVQTAVSIGADQAAFEACYDSEEALNRVLELDAIRRDRGVFSQPVFDIGGTLYAGAPPYEVFAETIDLALADLE